MEDNVAAGRSDVPGSAEPKSYDSPNVNGDQKAGSSSQPKLDAEGGEISLERSRRMMRLGKDLLQMLEECYGNTHRECDPQTDVRPTTRASDDSSGTSQHLGCSIEAIGVDKPEKTKEGTSVGAGAGTTGQSRPPAKCGSSHEKAAMDGKAGLGLEQGNTGIWKHIDEGGGTPTGGTIMNAKIGGIEVSVPLPAEAFCAWERPLSQVSGTVTNPTLSPDRPHLDPRPSSVSGGSGKGIVDDGNRDNSNERVADPSGGGSRGFGDSNPRRSASRSGCPASASHVRRVRLVDQGPANRPLDRSCNKSGVSIDIDHGHQQVVEELLLESSGNVIIDARRGGRPKTWGGWKGMENDSVAGATTSVIVRPEWRALRRGAIATLSRQLRRTTAERDRLQNQVRRGIWNISAPSTTMRHGKTLNRENRIPAMVNEAWEVPAGTGARRSLQRQRVARRVKEDKRRWDHVLGELRDGDGGGVVNVPVMKAFRSPRLKSTGQAALIMRGAVRSLVRITLLSAWRRWKYFVLPPTPPQRTHYRSSSAWKTRQNQPCLQTPPSYEVPDADENMGLSHGEVPSSTAPMAVGDLEGLVGSDCIESFRNVGGGERDLMIRNECEEEKAEKEDGEDRDCHDRWRRDQPASAACFLRSSVARDFGSPERRNAPSSPRSSPKSAPRSPLDDDRGPLGDVDYGQSRSRDGEVVDAMGKGSRRHVGDVAGSRRLAGGCKATPWRPPGSPGTGSPSITMADTPPRSIPTKPISLYESGTRLGGAWNGDVDAGGSPRRAGPSDESFAGRRSSKSQPLPRGSRLAGMAAVRPDCAKRKPTYLAPTASSRHKTKMASQVQSRDVGDRYTASRKPFIPSGIGRAQPPKGQSRSSPSHWSQPSVLPGAWKPPAIRHTIDGAIPALRRMISERNIAVPAGKFTNASIPAYHGKGFLTDETFDVGIHLLRSSNATVNGAAAVTTEVRKSGRFACLCPSMVAASCLPPRRFRKLWRLWQKQSGIPCLTDYGQRDGESGTVKHKGVVKDDPQHVISVTSQVATS